MNLITCLNGAAGPVLLLFIILLIIALTRYMH